MDKGFKEQLNEFTSFFEKYKNDMIDTVEMAFKENIINEATRDMIISLLNHYCLSINYYMIEFEEHHKQIKKLICLEG